MASNLGDWSFSEHIGKVAPIITALIALSAAVVAILSLRTQVYIARRRAAIDVFLKTEMDQAMLIAYRDYVAGLKTSKQYSSTDKFEQDNPAAYSAVRTYLDVNELIWRGINHKSV
jgi:hypothetical protein